MRRISGRARQLEFAISIVILFILVAVAAVLLTRQSRYEPAKFGIGEIPQQQGQMQQADSPQAEDETFSIKSLQPASFSAMGEPETYTTDNLYEKIDGKAPLYQESGFESLITQRFISDEDPNLGLELYLFDMGRTKNAFSVYSRQKRADGVELEDFPFAYATSNAIYLSLGRYYVEIIGFAESNELVDAMKDMAQKISDRIGINEADKIEELGFFPPDETIAGSEKLYLNNAFGFEGLGDTYSARYRVDDQTVTIFFSKQAGNAEAQTVAKSYRDFLLTNGAEKVAVDSETLDSAGASVLDFYGATEIIFTTGDFIGGVHEADDRESAVDAAEILLERLKDIND